MSTFAFAPPTTFFSAKVDIAPCIWVAIVLVQMPFQHPPQILLPPQTGDFAPSNASMPIVRASC